MIENINYLIDFVGGKNDAINILYFSTGILFSLYLYFRSFCRLVYSSERVCEKGREIKDWRDEENEYTTRVLFYNNGGKTLTSTEIKKLEINSTNDILSVKLLEELKGVKFDSSNRRIDIEIEYLDSSKFFVLEIEHKGYIEVEGRISETGEILRTEPRYWVIINCIFMIYFLYSTFNILFHLNDPNSNPSINIFLIIGSFVAIRFMHSLLFIPDSVVGKYLQSKDKFNIEFRNNF